MSVKVSAIVSKTPDGYLAQCTEVDCAGLGATVEEALAALRTALEEYFHPEAVAPPAQSPRGHIEIVVVDR